MLVLSARLRSGRRWQGSNGKSAAGMLIAAPRLPGHPGHIRFARLVHSFSGSSKGVASWFSRTLIRLKAPSRSALSWSTVSAKDPIKRFMSFIVIFPLLLLVFFALESECVYGRGEREFFGLIGYRIAVSSYAMPKASAGLGERVHFVFKEL